MRNDICLAERGDIGYTDAEQELQERLGEILEQLAPFMYVVACRILSFVIFTH